MKINQKENCKINSQEELIGMRNAGQLAAKLLDILTKEAKEGVSLNYLNQFSEEFIRDNNAIPAPLNYKGFPKSICISVNDVVCHGIPSDKLLKNGDIANIDVTVILDGWHGDTSRMYWIGEPPVFAKRLSKVTYECMMSGIEQVKPGNKFGDVGYAIQSHAEKHGYSVVKGYCGHGIGRIFHGPPNVLNFGQPGTGVEIELGMTFTVEPMINAGSETVRIGSDGWTVRTKDRSLSAQFEHTIVVSENGYEILTKSLANLDFPPYAI